MGREGEGVSLNREEKSVYVSIGITIAKLLARIAVVFLHEVHL